MREPYATLFEGYGDHPILGPYLWGDEPDWEGLLNEERLAMLSSGENILIAIAGAFAGDRTARFADLGGLDEQHRYRVAMAILRTAGVA
jgi:hypothetical protein